MIAGIITAALVVAGTGVFIGIFLGIAGERFKVEENEKEVAIREVLPGNNCGGCGFAGCDALAAAIVKGEAAVAACPVGGEPVAAGIAEILGVEAGDAVRMSAFVACGGTCEKAKDSYDYYGVETCQMAAMMQKGGPKACAYGCLGYGSCVEACEFDAIGIMDGIAVVDREACRACGKCITACPKGLISLIPYGAVHAVRCSSKDKGRDVMQVCETGCIGCGICVRACEAGAVAIQDNVAVIDQEKCTGCGACAEKCPKKIIS